MMHDPFQTYSMLSAYPGTTAALGLNPLAGGISPFGQPGIGGLIPQLQQQHLQQQLQQHLQQQILQQQILQQQLQLAAILGQHVGNPQMLGISHLGGLHNPLATLGLQNPLFQNPLAQILQNPLVNPVLAQHYQSQFPQIGYGGSPFGQVGSQLGQTGSPFGQIGYPLAPQSWIGQPGLGGGSPFVQGHPLLSQLAGRGIQGYGFSPWSGI